MTLNVKHVVIPLMLRNKVLEEIHVGHIGIVKMKALSRSFFWWPGHGNEIEQLAKRCAGCQFNQKLPTKSSVHPWEWPSAPWERIHIDFAGPFLGHMFLAHLSQRLRVSYCHQPMSVVRRQSSVVRRASCVVCRQQLLQTTSPLKPLGLEP